MANSTFQHNLALFSKFFPQEAVFFSNLEEKEKIDLKNSLPEIKEEGLKNKEALYIYGIPSLKFLKKLEKIVLNNPQITLCLFEDEVLSTLSFFHEKEASFFLSYPRCRFFFFQDKENALFENVYFETLATKFEVVASTSKTIEQKEELKDKLLYDAALRSAFIEEYYSYGAPFFKNYYPNLFEMPKSLYGRQLFQKFKGIPAIICGAGPSLNKHLSKLPSLLDKALIFAGGSSLNALTSAGIMPHFGVGVDPNTLQEERLLQSAPFKIPFFYRSRISHKALQCVQGEKIFIGGAGGYDIADWVEGQLGLPKEEMEEGYNVVNFSVELAHALGCNPIIFIGVDLAFTNKETYAKGVSKDVLIKEEDFKKEQIDEMLLLKKDIYGKGIYTLYKWVAESNWISTYKEEHPETDFINATEGGLGFRSLVNLPFEEVIKKRLTTTYPLKEKLFKEMKKAVFPHSLTEKKIEGVLNTLKLSIEESLKLIQEILQEEKKPVVKNMTAMGAFFPSLSKSAYLEQLLEEEAAYKALLEMFLAVYTKGATKSLRELQREEDFLSPEEVEKRYKNLKIERLLFLENALKANLILLSH